MRTSFVLAAALLPAAAVPAQLTLDPIGTYPSGVFDEGAAEIGAFDADSQRFFVTNADANTLDVLDLSVPAAPSLLFTVDLSAYGDGVNSVAVHEGLVAVAVQADPKTDPGRVVFLDVDGNLQAQATVGALPDMVTFTPNGKYLLVANEGEPDDDYVVDPEGSISVVDLRKGLNKIKVRTAGFGKFNSKPIDPAIRIFGPGATVAQDLEPEYIAVGPFGKFAWVSCQENNALALVRIKSAKVVALFGLGLKDHSAPGNALDPSNRDDAIAIANWPVHGMYQPDAIAVTSFWGIPFVLSANEGDARDYDGFSEEERLGGLVFDPVIFPDAATLQLDENLGRLNSTTAGGDTDGDGDQDVLLAYGARSMSVWSPLGKLVWDGGDDLEQVTAALLPDDFNSTNDENDSFDNRSDDKGPEPEGITVGTIDGRTYAFLGCERISGIAVYDVTNPWSPTWVTFVHNRDFAGDAEAGTAGDLGPEGLCFIPACDSPSGQDLLVVTNEVSGTTTVWGITAN